jgi:hypothetical protein
VGVVVRMGGGEMIRRRVKLNTEIERKEQDRKSRE